MDTLVIDGTPTAVGDYNTINFGVSANGGGCNASASWSIDAGPPTITSVSASTCGGGVTLYGTELDGIDSSPPTVTFGGVASTVTGGWTDGETIFPVTLPSDAPTGVPIDVKVLTDAGTATYSGYVIPAQPAAATTGGARVNTNDLSATLLGTVSPGCNGASYHFEYGPERAGGSYAYTASTPVQSLPGGATDVSVTAATVSGLKPGTTYHYRVVASNGAGAAAGADDQFTIARHQVHIGPFSVSLSARLKRLAAQLKGQAQSLEASKRSVQAAIDKRQANLKEAIAAQARLDEQRGPIAADLATARGFLALLLRDERQLPAPVRAEEQARIAVEQAIARLEDEIAAAEQAGDHVKVSRLQGSLSNEESQLRILDRELAGRTGGVDGIAAKWLAKVRFASKQLYALLLETARADNARQKALAELEAPLSERAYIDSQLVVISEQLANADFMLSNVSATADGQLVYYVQSQDNSLALDAIRQKIADAAAQRDKLLTIRQRALTRFRATGRMVDAAAKSLHFDILALSIADASTETAFFVEDVLEATAKGGPTAGLSEAAKKGLDGWLSKAVPEPSGIIPGSEEDRINKEFGAGLRTSVTATASARTLGLRLSKEYVTKPLRDDLNRSLGNNVYKKAYGFIPREFIGPLPALPPLGRERTSDYLRKVIKVSGSREAQLAELTKVSGFEAKKLVISLLKDAAKQAYKGYIDHKRTQAWIQWYEAELLSRESYAFFAEVNQRLLDADATLAGLQEQEQALIAGYDPLNHTRTILDSAFNDTAKVQITLSITRPAGATLPLDLHLTLAGSEAAIQPNSYILNASATGPTPGPDGLGLVFEAR